MEYFRILDLEREPFSNSPDPAFFYPSAQHRGCLQQVELAIRLRRGLNVVLGDVGTGKTTLCRDLIRRFAAEETIEAYLLLDPGTAEESAFLRRVSELLTGSPPPPDAREDSLKEAVKALLFEKAVALGRTVVLIVDEGQKLSPSGLEVLRELLNYETNEHKLLQIVIFAQKEFERTLRNHPNFADRINLRFDLRPLGFRDTVAFIRYRIQRAGGPSAAGLFSLPALVAVFVTTRGYPRRIVHLCHRILLALIVQNRMRAGWRLARASARRTTLGRPVRRRRWAAVVGLLALSSVAVGIPREWLPGRSAAPTAVATPAAEPASAVTMRPQAPSSAATAAMSGQPDLAPPAADPPAGMDALNPSAAFATQATRIAQDPQPPPAVPMTLPARLGRVTIAPNETLGLLIKQIYGRFTPAHLTAVKNANPHIADPDRLNIGDVVHFPALPSTVRPLPVPVWWVQLAEYRRLEDALQALRRQRAAGRSVRLLPYWNPDQHLVFALVLAECYYDRGAAAHGLQQLPPAESAAGAVRRLYREDTVYFCDPFQMGADRQSNLLPGNRFRRA